MSMPIYSCFAPTPIMILTAAFFTDASLPFVYLFVGIREPAFQAGTCSAFINMGAWVFSSAFFAHTSIPFMRQVFVEFPMAKMPVFFNELRATQAADTAVPFVFAPFLVVYWEQQ